MAHLVNPFVDEPLYILARGFFYRGDKLLGLNVLPLVFLDIMAYSFKESVIAEDKTEHAKRSRSLLICVSIKQGVRVAVAPGHYRPPDPARPYFQVLLL